MKCTFSFKHYRYILEKALNNNYIFIDFNSFKKKNKYFKNKKICILRHDIDYMPSKMLEFSNIEYKLGIKATYFIQNTSYAYNLNNFYNLNYVRELIDQKHHLALHFDPLVYQFNFNKLSEFVKIEKNKLKLATESRIEDIISFHNPHKYSELILNKTIKNISHTYESIFFSKIKYLSDSQGWYESCPCKIFEKSKYNHIQLLTHPYLWDSKPKKDFAHDISELVYNKNKEYLNFIIESHPIAKKNKNKIIQILKKNYKKLR